MSALLDRFRQNFPQYKDVDDDTLADALYNKQYAGKISRKEFEVHLGRDPITKRHEQGFTPGFSSLVDYAVNPFGLKDEIDWVGGYARGLIQSGFDVEAAQKEANEAMEWRRAYDKVKRKKLGMVPRLVGDIATIATNPQAAVPTLGTRLAQGAGFGAAYGAGESEGGVEERLGGALTGGAIGLGAGAAFEAARPVFGLLAKGTKTASRTARDVFGDVVPGAKRNTEARIRRALEQQNMTPDDALAAYEQGQAATRLGSARTDLPEMPVDLGPAMQRLGIAVHTRPGRGAVMAEEALEGRARTQFGRVRDHLAQSLRIKRGDFFRDKEKIIAEQRLASAPAYSKAFREAPPINISTPLLRWEMRATREAGDLRDALEKAIGTFRNKYAPGGRSLRTRREPLVTLKQIDAAKRALDDQIGAAKRAGRNSEVRLLTEFKNDIIDVADQATTVQTAQGPQSLYAMARSEYSSRAALLDAMEAGRRAFRGDVEMSARAYRALTPGEQRMFKIGVAQEVKRKLGDKRLGNDMASFFDTPNRRELMQEIMGPKGWENFQTLMAREQQAIRSRNLITRGSQTEVRAEAVQDFNIMMRLGRAFREQGLVGAVMNGIGDAVALATRMSEQDAYRVAKILFETDPAKIRRFFSELSLKYGAQRARQARRAAIAAGMRYQTLAGASASIGGQEGAIRGDQGRLSLPSP